MGFTPQYGDSFVEQLRLCVLTAHVLPRARALAAARARDLDEKANNYLKAALSSPSPSGAAASIPSHPPLGTPRSGDNGGGGADGPLAHLLLACEEAGLLSSEALLASLPVLKASLARPLGTAAAAAARADGDAGGGSGSEGDCDSHGGGGGGVCVRGLEATRVDGLARRCTNADPNYGSVWFQCRSRAHLTARRVLQRAQQGLARELFALAPLYLQAWARRLLVERALVAMATAAERFRAADAALCHDDEAGGDGPAELPGAADAGKAAPQLLPTDPAGRAAHRLARAALPEADEEPRSRGVSSCQGPSSSSSSSPATRAAPARALASGRAWEGACECALRRAAPVDPLVLGLPPRAEDFATGLVGLNRHGAHVSALSDEHRRKILFGCDQIIP
jgi:hypothetical protein